MAKKTTYQVTINGRKATRKSARPYTHCVLALQPVRTSSHTLTDADKASACESAAFYRAMAAADWKPVPGRPGYFCANAAGRFWDCTTQQNIDGYKANAAANSDDAAAIENAAKWRQQQFRKALAEGAYCWQAVRWSQSYPNAMAGAKHYQGYGWGVKIVAVGESVELPGDVNEHPGC